MCTKCVETDKQTIMIQCMSKGGMSL